MAPLCHDCGCDLRSFERHASYCKTRTNTNPNRGGDVAECEWNPAENRPAFDDDPPHGEATQVIGVDGKWHLCDGCATLPEFARYRKRSGLARRVPLRVKRRANRQAQATTEPSTGAERR
jgi:hypothetical protein